MSTQQEIEKLRTLQECFNNLAEKAQIVVIDPNAYMPCDRSKIDEFFDNLPIKEEE
jgi:hypothetical protein